MTSAETLSLLTYLEQSPTAMHAAACTLDALRQAGYQELSEQEHWRLTPGGRYLVSRNGSAVIAWRQGETHAFRLVLSHLDSPGLRLKLHAATQGGGVLVVPVERYSQTIDSGWLDQPLTLAGRVVTPDGQQHLFAFPQALAIIPNLAIHLNRKINDGNVYNAQQHLRPLFGDITLSELRQAIARQAGLPDDDFAASDIALVQQREARILGLRQDLLNAPRLDNLLAAHALLCALTTAEAAPETAVAFFADNEEIGSCTPEGANSSFLRDVLERIVLASGGDREELFCALARSTMLSVDAAHALHPNYAGSYDPGSSPIINQGVVVKWNANGRYATSAAEATRLARLADTIGVPLQRFHIRADMACGSTIGPMTAARLGVPAVDLGNPIWAMHSVRETAGLRDQGWMTALLTAFLGERH